MELRYQPGMRDEPPEKRGWHVDGLNDPRGYIPDPGLIDAVNVALTLRRPLLLTGEPGTGKTQLAYSLAWELRLDQPLKFETKSTSSARDFFYSFDTLARLRDIQASDPREAASYLDFRALGEAILRARGAEDSLDWLPERARNKVGEPGLSVVLLDEVDKAPRDVPNDVLNEIEEMYFVVHELENRIVRADRDLLPIVVITSNSEKHLPDAFLRRCVFYDLPFPNGDQLRQIVTKRIGGINAGNSSLLSEAVDLFQHIREPRHNLQKPPGTAEFLNWLSVLIDPRSYGLTQDDSLRSNEAVIGRTQSALIKMREDQRMIQAVVAAWSSPEASTAE